MDWQDFATAFGLMLVFEGLMPFLAPEKARLTLRLVSRIPDRDLRIIGLIIMLIGAALIYFIRG